MEKRPFDVYLVQIFDNGSGYVTEKRTLAGRTWAVSAEKARVNVEYRNRGKAVYGGANLYDMGQDSSVYEYFEAKEVI